MHQAWISTRVSFSTVLWGSALLGRAGYTPVVAVDFLVFPDLGRKSSKCSDDPPHSHYLISTDQSFYVAL